MTELTSLGRYDTSLGTAFVLPDPPALAVGEVLSIDGGLWRVERIVLPSRPDARRRAAVIVSPVPPGSG